MIKNFSSRECQKVVFEVKNCANLHIMSLNNGKPSLFSVLAVIDVPL